MQPKTISEYLMFSTVRLEAENGSSGTGFFYIYNIDDEKICQVLVTNKHVVNNNPNEIMTFYLHLKGEDGNLCENYKVKYQADWIFHSSKDLCFCFINPLNPLFEYIKNIIGQKEVFTMPIDDTLVASEENLETLSALEEVVMVGYPIGLWDEKNNFPIFRRGYTASHPALDFNEEGIGLVDMACFPGSSGSPIFILNENGYSDRDGNTYLGAKRIILIGILYSGPVYRAEGEVIVREIPTTNQAIWSTTSIMTNLGYYIKGVELHKFRDFIMEYIESHK